MKLIELSKEIICPIPKKNRHTKKLMNQIVVIKKKLNSVLVQVSVYKFVELQVGNKLPKTIPKAKQITKVTKENF